MKRIRILSRNSEESELIELPKEKYMDMLNDGKHLIYSDDNFLIRLPMGSWDIMGALVPKILKYRQGDIIEIGMGESTTVFADYANKAGVNLYSCDIQMGGMFKVFKEKLFDNHICFIGKSEEFMKTYYGNPSIVFLDGEHKYETIKKEVEFFLPRLRPGGVMFMHDTFPPLERQLTVDKNGFAPGDIYKARQELECRTDVDVFTWPYSALNMGLTMVMKHEKDRPYWRVNGREFN